MVKEISHTKLLTCHRSELVGGSIYIGFSCSRTQRTRRLIDDQSAQLTGKRPSSKRTRTLNEIGRSKEEIRNSLGSGVKLRSDMERVC